MGDSRLGFGTSSISGGGGSSTSNYNVCSSGFVIPKKSKKDVQG